MAAECVDGQMATPHITGAQKGALHAGVFGTASRVLAVGNQLKAIQNSATSVTIQTGEAVVHGRHCEVTGATTVTIASGTQGQKRNDLICLRYSRASTGIESCDLVVLRGNATTGTASDPSVPSGNVLNGDAQDYFPLYRVSLNGTTAAAPVRLFTVSPTLASLGDSVSPVAVSVSPQAGLGTGGVTCFRAGSVATVMVTGSISKSNAVWGNLVIAEGLPATASSYAYGQLVSQQSNNVYMLTVNQNGTLMAIDKGIASLESGWVFGSVTYVCR